MLPNKKRLDLLLVEKGLVPTREKAQAMIIAGDVLVNDVPVTKPGTSVADDAVLRLRNTPDPYVSRAAHKLIKALDEFQIDPRGLTGLDVGSSTGGFTQVLLERGAKKVFAIDVGTNQLHYSLRKDSRVEVREQTNARYLTPADFGEPLHLGVTDVSFISLRIILPVMAKLLVPDSNLVSLYKPQFEVGPEHLEKGILKDQAIAELKRNELIEEMKSQNLVAFNVIPSPILGAEGNVEYLIHWKCKSAL